MPAKRHIGVGVGWGLAFEILWGRKSSVSNRVAIDRRVECCFMEWLVVGRVRGCPGAQGLVAGRGIVCSSVQPTMLAVVVRQPGAGPIFWLAKRPACHKQG